MGEFPLQKSQRCEKKLELKELIVGAFLEKEFV